MVGAGILDLNEYIRPSVGRLVLVGGCFDIIHKGHIDFLQRAREAGDFLVVALESDKSIMYKKKKCPIHIQSDRADILSSIRYVDLVILLPALGGYEDYLAMARKIGPSLIAVTDPDLQMENKSKIAAAVGASLVVVTSLIQGRSTSAAVCKMDGG